MKESFEQTSLVAESLVLLGPNGKPAARLHSNDLEGTLLSFYDEKQSVRLNLGLSPRGQPGVDLFDTKTGAKISLFVDAESSTPNVLLFGQGPFDPTMLLAIGENGPRMSIWEPKRGRCSMGLNDQGQPTMTLRGTGNSRGMSLSASEDGADIALTGKDGIRRATWSLLPDGSPAVHVADRAGRVTLEITVDKDGNPAAQKIEH